MTSSVLRASTSGLIAVSLLWMGGCAGESTGTTGWSPVGGPQGFITGLAVNPREPGIVYSAVRGRGLFRSTDGGGTWRRPANTGLTLEPDAQGAPLAGTHSVGGVAVDPQRPMTVYAIDGNSGLVIKSSDGGGSWRATHDLSGAGGFNSVTALTMNPRNPATVYAAGWQGVHETRDGGGTWHDVSAGLSDDVLTAVGLDRTHPGTLYVGTEDGDLWKTVNGGGMWGEAGTASMFDEVQVIATDTQEPNTVYAGTGGGGVARSRDGGLSWEAVNNGLPGEADKDELDVSSLAFDPRSPGVVYAALGESGVYRSEDSGNSWSPLNSGLGDRAVYHLAFDARAGVLFAGSSQGVLAYNLSA